MPSYPEAELRRKEGDDGIRALRDEVFDALDSKTHLVDVRSPQEYSGELIAMAGYEQEGRSAGVTSPARPRSPGPRPSRRTAPSSRPTS